MIDLPESDDDYLDTYKKNKKKHKDSDEEYNIEEDEELYSNIDEDDDISYIMNRTSKKHKHKKNVENNKNEPNKNKPIRISFRKSLGVKKLKTKKKFNEIDTPFKNRENVCTKSKLSPSNKLMKTNKEKEEKRNFQNNINLDKSYFYQNMTPTQWKEISNFLTESLFTENLSKENIINFFARFPNLSKGENNLKKLRQR